MSTRATYHFPEQNLTIYCHHDGYPDFPGACVKLHNMLTAQCKGGLVERFVVGNADEAEITLCDHGDTEYEYHLSTDDPSGLRLRVYAVGGDKMFDGSLVTWLTIKLAEHEEFAPVVVYQPAMGAKARTMTLPALEAIAADKRATLGGWIAKGMDPKSANVVIVGEEIDSIDQQIAEQGIGPAARFRWAA